MSLGKINLITPPDNLFNLNPSYLLVKPSTKMKMQFQTLLSAIPEDINVYVYDTDEVDIAWMLNAANNSDFVIIDVDHCDSITKNFVGLLLAQHPNAFFMTNDELTPWNLISRNRIYNLDWILEALQDADDQEEQEEDDDEGIQ
jgi:hypothetical protein